MCIIDASLKIFYKGISGGANDEGSGWVLVGEDVVDEVGAM